MKKKLLTLLGSICLVLVLVALLLPACAKEEAPVAPTPARPTPVAPTPAPTPAAPAGYEWPDVLRVVSHSVGSSDYARWCGIAPLIEKSTGMKVRVTPEDIDTLKVVRLYEKECDLSTTSDGDVEMGICGAEAHSDKPRLRERIMWPGNDLFFSFCVRGDSKIKSIYDIKKGTRVVKITHSSAMQLGTTAIIEGLGLRQEDIVWVPVGSFFGIVRAVMEGRADAGLFMTLSSQEAEANPKGIRWLDLPFEDKQLWESLVKVRPTAMPVTVSWGPKSSLGHSVYGYTYVFFTLAENDQELMYHLAKWFNENYDAYKDTSANAARMGLDVFRNLLNYTSVPIAEGTIKYLKEIGEWAAKDDEWNQAGVEVNEKYIKAWEAAAAEAKSKGIEIDYKNEEWVDLWDAHKTGLPRLKIRL